MVSLIVKDNDCEDSGCENNSCENNNCENNECQDNDCLDNQMPSAPQEFAWECHRSRPRRAVFTNHNTRADDALLVKFLFVFSWLCSRGISGAVVVLWD